MHHPHPIPFPTLSDTLHRNNECQKRNLFQTTSIDFIRDYCFFNRGMEGNLKVSILTPPPPGVETSYSFFLPPSSGKGWREMRRLLTSLITAAPAQRGLPRRGEWEFRRSGQPSSPHAPWSRIRPNCGSREGCFEMETPLRLQIERNRLHSLHSTPPPLPFPISNWKVWFRWTCYNKGYFLLCGFF